MISRRLGEEKMRWRLPSRPVVEMESAEAKTFMDQRPASKFTLLDVRQPAEYEKAHLPGARLVPLSELADRLGELDRDKPVIVYCAVGGRSRSAAQLLDGQGFAEVYSLQGGLKAWQGQKAAGPPEMGLAWLRGDETAPELVVLAYGLEGGLAEFYTAQARAHTEEAVVRLLEDLAAVERRHQERLARLFDSLNGAATDRAALAEEAEAAAVEGGWTTAEFVALFGAAFTSPAKVLEVAMAVEAQALDLYLRCVEVSAAAETQSVLHDLAAEEKGHLAALGGLLEKYAGE